MEAACLAATTPHSTCFFQPATTSTPAVSTPAVGGAESLSHTKDPSFEASIDFDHSVEDERAQESIEDFIQCTCGCKVGPRDSPCLSKPTIEKRRADNLELKLDLVILT